MAEIKGTVTLDVSGYLGAMNKMQELSEQFKGTENGLSKAMRALANTMRRVESGALSGAAAQRALERDANKVANAFKSVKGVSEETSRAVSKSLSQVNTRAKELKVSADQLKEKVASIGNGTGVITKLGESLKSAINDKIPLAGKLASELGKFGPAVAAAAGAAALLGTSFMSVESNADKVREKISGWKSAFDDFKQHMGGGISFGGDIAYKAGKEKYQKEDYLGSVLQNNRVAINLLRGKYKDAELEYEQAKASGDKAKTEEKYNAFIEANKKLSAKEEEVAKAADVAASSQFKSVVGVGIKQEIIDTIEELYKETGQDVMTTAGNAKTAWDNYQAGLKLQKKVESDYIKAPSQIMLEKVNKFKENNDKALQAIIATYGDLETAKALVGLANNESSKDLQSYIANKILAGDLRSSSKERSITLAPKGGELNRQNVYKEGQVGYFDQEIERLRKQQKDDTPQKYHYYEDLIQELESSKGMLGVIKNSPEFFEKLLKKYEELANKYPFDSDKRNFYLDQKDSMSIQYEKAKRDEALGKPYKSKYEYGSIAYRNDMATHYENMSNETADASQAAAIKMEARVQKAIAQSFDSLKSMSDAELDSMYEYVELTVDWLEGLKKKGELTQEQIGELVASENLLNQIETQRGVNKLNATKDGKTEKPKTLVESTKDEIGKIKGDTLGSLKLDEISAYNSGLQSLSSSTEDLYDTFSSLGEIENPFQAFNAILSVTENMISLIQTMQSLGQAYQSLAAISIASSEAEAAAKGNEAAANTVAASSEVVSQYTAIPIVGWAIGLTVAASLLAAMAIQKKKAKAELKFEEGGIVGGNSYTGDRVHAMVNSGEMILNRKQQANLFNIANGVDTLRSGTQRIEVFGTSRISGKDIEIVYSDRQKSNKRR